MRQCPSCGTLNNKNAQFCETCGTSLKDQPTVKSCPQCGQVILESSNFCQHCGYQFTVPTAQMTPGQPRVSRKPPKQSVGSRVVLVFVIIVIAVLGAFSWRMYRQTQTNTQNDQREAQQEESQARQSSMDRMKAARSSSVAERRANSRATSSRRASLDRASSSSVAAESSRQAESSRKADLASSSESESESVADTARSLRSMLVTAFGCDEDAVASLPDKELADISSASNNAGEDIGGFYNRVKERHPEIGGNIMGPDADESDADSD
ncbi:zinc ribbon domain-containing protein [Lactiplantibacillus daoliensis]|uniref:Zinc ribbon domain-containing protein n=1 Tax=Lactiplantibacillus daoliensis TaxID=2559916 RepID=A0ABW1UL25_9LACO|nr:zinc ribbon domain-containing protein [Lactiplantibacillus daoliensis]